MSETVKMRHCRVCGRMVSTPCNHEAEPAPAAPVAEKVEAPAKRTGRRKG